MWMIQDATQEQLAEHDKSVTRVAGLLAQRSRLDAQIVKELSVCFYFAFGAAERGNHPDNGDSALKGVSAEIGTAARINDRTVEHMVCEAQELVTDYPQTLDRLENGLISLQHAKVIVGAGQIVDEPELRAAYESAVLPYAEKETANRLRPVAKRLAEQFTQATLEERHAEARTFREVRVQDLNDGMANLIATLPAAEAYGIKDRLSQMAYAAEAHGRSIPELRADILTDLLLTAHPVAHTTSADALGGTTPCPTGCGMSESGGTQTSDQDFGGLGSGSLGSDGLGIGNLASGGLGCGGLGTIQARIMITIPVLTLLPQAQADLIRQNPQFQNIAGLDGGAQLAGYGPIDAQTAKQLVGTAKGWDRVLIHPLSAAVLAVDRYRPSQDLRRTLTARDLHCRFPGCRIPVSKCDLDHTIDAAFGGPTRADNLAYLCRRHHTLKHQSDWTVQQLQNGNLKWISPTGRPYLEEPPSTIMHKPNPFDGPPPF